MTKNLLTGLDSFLKVFKTISFIMGSGRLFHKEGPILRQGFLPSAILAKRVGNLFLVSILLGEANSKS